MIWVAWERYRHLLCEGSVDLSSQVHIYSPLLIVTENFNRFMVLAEIYLYKKFKITGYC